MMNDNEIIRDFFMSRLERDGKSEALLDYTTGIRYYYQDFDVRSRKFANFLTDKAKIKKGDRVAICAGNCVQHIDMFYAIVRTGYIMTSYNVKLTERELSELILKENPSVVLYEEEFGEKAAALKKRFPEVAFISTGNKKQEGDLACYQEVLEYSDEDRSLPDHQFEDIAMLVHTGGTTGIPKAAMISYRALYYNVINQVTAYGVNNRDVVYVCLPLFHAAARNSLLMPLLYVGARMVMTRKFDKKDVFQIMKQEHLTFLLGVPTIFQYMMEDPAFETADFSEIGRIRCGAAPASLEIMRAYWKKGVRFCNGYGMTEVGPGVLAMPINSMSVKDIEEKRLSVGKPMVYVKLRIVNEKGEDVPKGEKGELLIRSAAMFSGYWGDPKETELALQNGWMHSGDIAQQDEEGYYYIVGRKKNMFISHGENIYPVEIENIMKEYPGIHEVCVIGVPDKRKGEVGKAIVVLKEGSKATAEDIKEYCSKNLAKIKQPKYVEIVEEIPRNSVGKVLMSKVHELYGNVD